MIFLKLFGEKRSVKSAKVFPASIELINPIQKYPHIFESYACFICFYVFITDKCCSLFWNMLYSEIIKINNVTILYVQSNPVSFNIRVLIKIDYICPILYF